MKRKQMTPNKTLAIIVNYKIASLALEAARSVLESDCPGPLELVVVDNSADPGEAQALRAGLPAGTELIITEENIGFGRACNAAYHRFPADSVLLVNPDARLLPGCLARLQETLSSSARIGAVAPQAYWDDCFHFLLPPSHPIGLFFFAPVLGRWNPDCMAIRFLSRLWRAYSIRTWCARRPIRTNNLSGGLVLLKKEAIQRAGGLFDPRFFLYFEDTDLFLRMKRAGYRLAIDPGARAIHYYDQSGHHDLNGKRLLMDASFSQFYAKHASSAVLSLNRMVGALRTSEVPTRLWTDPPDFTGPFEIRIPSGMEKQWVFEWSPAPTFVPASARIGAGPVMAFPEECWKRLAPGRYFGRLGALRTIAFSGKRFSWDVS